MKGRGHLLYTAANRQRENDVVLVPNLIGNRSMIFGSTEAEPVEIKREPIVSLILSKTEVLIALGQYSGRTMEPMEVSVLIGTSMKSCQCNTTRVHYK